MTGWKRRLQVLEFMNGTFQRMAGAHDSYVSPENVLDVANEIVGILSCRLRLWRSWSRLRGLRRSRMLLAEFGAHGASRAFAKYQALQKGIAGKPIGSVDSG